MSLRPGIGFNSMHEVASVVLDGDYEVPMSLRHGAKEWPLGRYLRHALSRMCGDHEKRRQAWMDEAEKELRPLREAARKNKEKPSFRQHLVEQNAGKVASKEARYKIFNSRKKL